MYADTGRYAEADPLYKQALSIFEKALGPDHPDTGTALSNLALVYADTGRYAEADPLYKQALSIFEKALGSDHPDTGTALSNLAALYAATGRYAEAEPLYKQALSIFEKILGPDHSDTGTFLNNLALLYARTGRYAEAEPLYKRALSIREKALGPDHPDTGTALNNLAHLYTNTGRYTEAEPLYKRALSICEKALGPDHPDTGTSLNNLAALCAYTGRYAEAEPLYKRALSISEKALGPYHPDTEISLNNLSCLYHTTQQNEKALEFAKRAFEAQLAVRNESFSMLSENQRMDFISHQGNFPLQISVSIALQNPETNAVASRMAWKMLLRSKAAVLDATLEDHQNLSGNPEAEALFSQLGETKTRLSNLQMKDLSLIDEAGLTLYRDQMDSLQKTREDLEQQLARLSGRFREGRRASKVTAEAVREALPENSTLIEFFHFTPLVPETLTDNLPEPSPQYIAFVLTDGAQTPQLISIGDADPIDTLIDQCRIKMTRDFSVKTDLQNLYQMVWNPIQTAVGEKSRLLISPDGALNQLPFAALRNSNGNYLIEQHDIGYLACGRDLIRQIDEEQSKPPALFGDPEFDHISSLTNPVKKTLSRSVFRSIPTDGTRAMYRDLQFSSLPATREEVVQISAMLSGQAPSVFLGSSATEENLKKLLRPQLLHLATHGFYLSESDAQEDSKPWKNPMLRSGLALSGASASLTQTTPPAGEDGIVTAEEVGSLDLWGTQIVVLSACDTGRGKSISGEGVLGLRRAFVQAGTKNLMLTLWRVKDTFTKNLMLDFYRDYLKTGDAVGALSRIQRNRLANAKPRSWAPFLISVQGKGGL